MSFSWKCTHCHTPLSGAFDVDQPDDKPVFCCDGCRMVFQILKRHHLDEYYVIKKDAVMLKTPQPVTPIPHQYSHLDDPLALQKYTVDAEQCQMDFFLEGIHCVACLWLVERLGTMVNGIKDARLDLSRSVLRVTINKEGSFAAAAAMLAQIGYPPHPLEQDEDTDKLRKKDDRRLLLQLGTAGFCAGNIMLLFVSIYSGVPDHLLRLFLWLGFVLILPVMIFSASSFYQSALGALRAKQMNIDVPVSVALIGGFVASTYHLWIGSDEVYYDSLAMFVFLLLGTRILLRGLHQRVDQSSKNAQWLMPMSAIRCADVHDQGVMVPVEKLSAGDLIRVDANAMIPVDGKVATRAAYIDMHLLTGESAPVTVKPDEDVYAGTMNRGGAFMMVVTATQESTRLARMMDQLSHATKPSMVLIADRIAQWFLVLITGTATAVFIYFFNIDMNEGIRRSLALIIIACPCALALATPLAFTLGLRRCTQIGALLKGPEVLERLSLTEDIVLDKTGTVTEGRFNVITWDVLRGDDTFYDEIWSLEQHSDHAIARAIRDYIMKQHPTVTAIPLDHVEEVVGQGVVAQIPDGPIRIGRLHDDDVDHTQSGLTQVGLYRGDTCFIRIYLGDQIRPDAPEAVAHLKKRHHVAMLSGDLPMTVNQVAGTLAIDEAQGGLSPEDKQEVIQSRSHGMMVGDGANDALALASAFVSVAVSGSLEVSFRSADVYLTKPGIQALPSLLNIAYRTRAVIKRNLRISLFYNILGVTAALLGWVNPLVAAVVMPISSLTVLGSSFLGLRQEKQSQ